MPKGTGANFSLPAYEEIGNRKDVQLSDDKLKMAAGKGKVMKHRAQFQSL